MHQNTFVVNNDGSSYSIIIPESKIVIPETMLDTKTIGNRITDARKKVNISQAGLAEKLFISSQAVGKWERGESMPDIIKLNRLAEILGVDLNYFSGGIVPPVNETAPASFPPKVKIETASFAGEQGTELPSTISDKKLSWDMSRGNWAGADFSGLKNLHEKFSASNMQRCKFNGSDLSGLLLKSNHVESCDFSGSDISSSHIQSSHLVNNQFIDCSLRDADFSISHITGCDLSGADLTGVTIKASSLHKNKATDAVWNRTSFINSNLDDMVFNSKVEDCYFENCAFKKVTFQNATLSNTFFKNKSLKGIRFIDCHADRMTYEFLKNGKADLSGITLERVEG